MVCPPSRPRPFWLGDDVTKAVTDVVCILLGDHSLRVEDVPSGVVGVVSETPWPDASHPRHPLQRPCVTQVGERARSIRDGDLVIVDGDQGVVLVDPTDRVVAAYQAHQLGIVPQRRLFLEFAHQPVRLPDGREIRVSASVARPSDVAGALETGPDSLYVSGECLPETIQGAMRDAHGKPVAFTVQAEGCCELSIARAALMGDVTAVLNESGRGGSFASFREAVEMAAYQLANEGNELGHVRYGLLMHESISDPQAVLTAGVERIAASLPRGDLGGEWMEALQAAARSVVVPVEIVVDSGRCFLAQQVLELGINGVIAPPSDVQAWKEALRNSYALA